MGRSPVLAAALALLALGPASAAQRSRSEVLAGNGMAATSHPLATRVAVDILQKGGTAVDAAIAANAVLGLVEPMNSGIGGDLFAMVWDAKARRLHGLNASGRAPRAASIERFRELGLAQIPLKGALSLSVPGCVDGWLELHGRFGALPMAEILAPSIRYADEGVPVAEVVAEIWKESLGTRSEFPGFLETYAIDGRAPRKGEVFRNPELAASYRRIAREGRDGFYRGDIAEAIHRAASEQGGFLTKADLAAHRSLWVEPLGTSYRGYEVWELPPNGQGIAVLQMLNILERFDLAAMGFGSADYSHLLLETKKIVFEDRARFYADPEWSEVPVARLISKAYAAERARLLDMSKARSDYAAGEVLGGDTVYLSVADKEGNMVSLIQSNYWNFGSGLVPPGTGFVLQNRGALFSLEEGHANALAPGKRPFHTIIPAFVTREGRPFLAFGVMGGDFQPQGQVQVLVNVIDFGMDLQEAGDAPRLGHEGGATPLGERAAGAGLVGLEDYFRPELADELRSRGHEVRVGNSVMFFGGYQAIARDPATGVYTGATEVRKDGSVGGY